MQDSIYNFEVESIEGKSYSLDVYRGNILLIVNTASKCGFTPQFASLQQMYEEFAERGFVVLGFPCDQFGHQDPGSESEIHQFCKKNYGVTFPMHRKIDVNGDSTHPLFAWLKEAAPGILGTKAIKWNFTKFLVDREGEVIKRYAPNEISGQLTQNVQAALG